MRHTGGHKKQIAGAKSMRFIPILKIAGPTDHHINLILQMRLLQIDRLWPVYFDRHTAMPKQLQESLVLMNIQRAKRFVYSKLHDR